MHGKQPSGLLELARSKYRAPDPFLDIRGKFVVRRLAPDSRKIELNEKAATHVEGQFLEAMAFDLASIHAAGSAGVAALRRDLKKRPRDWLYERRENRRSGGRKGFQGVESGDRK